MTMHDALNMMIRNTRVSIIEKDAIFCYGMSKMTVVIESEDSAGKYKKL